MENNIQYIGEHLWPGIVGHLLIILSFTALLFTAYSYRNDHKLNDKSLKVSWKTLGRSGFIIHVVSIFSLIAILFYIMINQMYEYAYVFEHVSNDLPMRYIFSAFWEGQEGSFLLWMFWHAILGLILIANGGKWESPVMMFLALVQLIINSMILGIHIEIGDFVYKIGSNPTLLLRDVFDAPIFQTADYLSSIQGSGLNPLLQNYWMTIHPPTLFLGFATCTIPFLFAAAGFYTGDHKSWLRPCLKWALFSAGIFGLGILMGGAWAYEALTFGGYWAWDPVENMSLVPWLILIAGIHTNLVAQSTGRAIKSTYLYYSLAFILVLYSTYLTRSGVLGDTSVHAFTEMGLEPQLIFMVVFFLIIAAWLFTREYRKVLTIEKEESIYSREFWMFIGALVLFFSGIIITGSTSLPVFNKIIQVFNPEYAGKVIQEPIPHFNKFQIWIGVLICVLSGKAIFLKYKTVEFTSNKIKNFSVRNIVVFIISIILSWLLTLWIDLFSWKYIVLAIAGIFTVIANGYYLLKVIRLNPRMTGSVTSHMGFGIMIIGILASGLNESVITLNPFVGQDLEIDDDFGKSVTLIKNKPYPTENYWLTYEGDTIIGKTRTFEIKFVENKTNGNHQDSFYVYPNLLFSNDMTKVAAFNPGTRRTAGYDIFTRITSLPKSQIDIKFAREEEDSLNYKAYELNIGDSLVVGNNTYFLEHLSFNPVHEEYKKHESDLGIGLGIRVVNQDQNFSTMVEPALGLREDMLYQYAEKIEELGIKIRINNNTFDQVFTEEDKLEYREFKVKKNDSFYFQDMEVTLEGFSRNINHPNYVSEENDIAIQALLSLKQHSITDTLKPIYIIRGNAPFSLKDYNQLTGIHIRLKHIDPIKEVFTFQLARDKRTVKPYRIEVAENVPRTDIINFEAKLFPGINLFWLGSCLMLLGFFIAFYNRYKTSHA